MTGVQSRFCDQCGVEFGPDAKFCANCGQARDLMVTEEPKKKRSAPARRTVKWRSVDDEVDLENYPFAAGGSNSLLTSTLMLVSAFSVSGDGSGGPQPPLATTWVSLDEGVMGRCPDGHIQTLTEILGGFVKSSGLLGGSWDALEVQTPMGNSGLIMVSQADGAGTADFRVIVPLAYGVDPKKHDRAQVRSTVDWMLSKMSSPYMAYVPLVEDDSERDGLLDLIIQQSGTLIPGPLSDPEWLAEPNVSAVTSNLQGFPGAGSLRIGVLEEQPIKREVAVMRSGEVDLVDVPAGTVDVYAGWQLELSAMGTVGLMALGHRSLLSMIDALISVPALAQEFGGISPSE